MRSYLSLVLCVAEQQDPVANYYNVTSNPQASRGRQPKLAALRGPIMQCCSVFPSRFNSSSPKDFESTKFPLLNPFLLNLDGVISVV